MMKKILFPVTALAGLIGTASGASLSLDIQPTGGTTAAGYLAFEATNQDASAGATANYTEFGSTITVTLTTANLPQGNLDFRAVTRNGTDGATNPHNDWIGVDTRTSGVDVTFTLTVSGLPAGNYTWLSGHHDGGVNAGSNGNLDGSADYSFTDASGSTGLIADGITFTRQDVPDTPSFLSLNFTSNGTDDVVFSMQMDENQRADPSDTNSLFAFANSLVIEDAVPEPSTALLGLLGGLGLLRRRR